MTYTWYLNLYLQTWNSGVLSTTSSCLYKTKHDWLPKMGQEMWKKRSTVEQRSVISKAPEQANLLSLDNLVNWAKDHEEEQKRDSLQYSLGNETNCNNFKIGALKKNTSHYNIFSISLKYCTLVIVTTNITLFQFKSKLSLPQIYTLKILWVLMLIKTTLSCKFVGTSN